MEEAICGGVKTWQPSSILSNERQAIKRQAAQNGCMYARPAVPQFVPPLLRYAPPPPDSPGRRGTDRSSQVHLGAGVVTGRRCHSSQPSGGTSSEQSVGVCVRGMARGVLDGGGGGGWV